MNTTTTQAPSQTTAPPAEVITQMRTAIRGMDAMSRDGFGSVEAIAQLALLALENPEGQRFTDVLARALQTIRDTSRRTMDSISEEAEFFGCGHVDPAELRRAEAWRVMSGHTQPAMQPVQKDGAA